MNKNFIISSLNFLIELKEEFVWNFKMARGDELIFEEPFRKSFNGSRKVFDREYNTQIPFIKFSETLESEFSSQIINSIKLFVKHQIFDNKIFNTLDKNMFAFTQLRFFHNFIFEVILYYFKQAIIHLRNRKQFVSSSTAPKFATFLYELDVVFGIFRSLIQFFT